MPKLRSISNNSIKTKIIIALTVLLVIIVAIFIYQTYAYYLVTNSYNVIKGRIGSFVNGDLEVAIYLENDYNSNTYSSGGLVYFPHEYDGYEYKETVCDSTNNLNPVWDNNNYQLIIDGIIDSKTICTVYFDKLQGEHYNIELRVNGATPSTSSLKGFTNSDSSEAEMTFVTDYTYYNSTCTTGTGYYNVVTNVFYVANVTGNGYCFVNFGIKSGSAILATWENNGVTVHDTEIASTAFASVATTQEGVYPAEDNYGTSYYVRGASDYNYVKFGAVEGVPIWWNIIRINGDGTVRMIYRGTGTTVPAAGVTVTTKAFNAGFGNNSDVGYMYTDGVKQGLTTTSNAKKYTEQWYETNLILYRPYIADRIFCGDRASTTTADQTWPWPVESSTGGIGASTVTYYAARQKLFIGKNPTLICPSIEDSYTVENSTENAITGHGNGALAYPIALITADEVSFAGGMHGTDNSNTGFYLHNGAKYWTMSPYIFKSDGAYVYHVHSSGYLINTSRVESGGIALRVVVNLKANLFVYGSGTSTNPFELARP